jgi:hypothetical protein
MAPTLSPWQPSCREKQEHAIQANHNTELKSIIAAGADQRATSGQVLDACSLQ